MGTLVLAGRSTRGAQAGVKTLVLFHHDPDSTDGMVVAAETGAGRV